MGALFRLLIFIISIALSSISYRGGYYRYRRYRFYNRYDYYDDEDAFDFSFITNRIRASLRRRKVLKKCKNFLTKKNKSLIIKNSHVMIIFDTNKKVLTCMNIKNIKQTAIVEWYQQPNFDIEDNDDNKFEQTFDSICLSFDENSSYEGVLKALRSNFINITETKQQTKTYEKPEIQTKVTNLDNSNNNIKNAEIINLNNATEEQLSKLPGINIVIAKRIVKRINFKGDFESLEQMFTEMKIKKHFQKQLNKLICVKPGNKEKKQNNNNERIIDF